jgi:hypothetical protein
MLSGIRFIGKICMCLTAGDAQSRKPLDKAKKNFVCVVLNAQHMSDKKFKF